MSGHTGGVCMLHNRVWPCSVCNSVTVNAPTVPYPAEPAYTVAQIRERVRAAQEAIVREDYAGASTFAVERMSLAIERVLARAFPEDGGASDG
jgi:hypothetical protein